MCPGRRHGTQLVAKAGKLVPQPIEDEANPSNLVVSRWYAPGVGLVKMVLNGKTVTEELQSIESILPPVPAKKPYFLDGQ